MPSSLCVPTRPFLQPHTSHKERASFCGDLDEVAKDAPPTAARRTNAFQPRGKRSDSRVRVRGRLFARRRPERRARVRAVQRGWFNSEAGKMLRLTSPLASRFTAASLGLLDEVLFNAEERRSGDLEGERSERMGEIFSADFIKCAGEGKPHFIKTGWLIQTGNHKSLIEGVGLCTICCGFQKQP